MEVEQNYLQTSHAFYLSWDKHYSLKEKSTGAIAQLALSFLEKHQGYGMQLSERSLSVEPLGELMTRVSSDMGCIPE